MPVRFWIVLRLSLLAGLMVLRAPPRRSQGANLRTLAWPDQTGAPAADSLRSAGPALTTSGAEIRWES